MSWASEIGSLVFLLATGITGGRLLARGLRNGGLHERLLGITYLAGGPLGYVPLMLVMSGATPDDWTRGLRIFGHLNLASSAAALYLFNWRTFRLGSRGGAAAAQAAAAGVFLAWLGLVFVDGLEGRTLEGGVAFWSDFWLRAGAYVWAAAESLHQYARGRRRLALGLTEPVVVDRFRLWGIAMAAISAMFLTTFAVALTGGTSPPIRYIVDGALAVVTSWTIWITFFPSPRYLARLAKAS